MRAAVLVAPGRMHVREVPAASPDPTEVRLRVRAVGLCGTDFHIFTGHGNYHSDASGRLISLDEAPQILGHEFVGVVEETGRRVGDRSPPTRENDSNGMRRARSSGARRILPK